MSHFAQATTRFLLLSILLSLTVGCSSVEKWTAFEVDWDRRFNLDEMNAAYAPRDYSPRPENVEVLSAMPDLQAEGPLELSVEQATLLALRHNRDLAVEQLSPVIAGAYELVERGVYDPQAFVAAGFARDIGIETSRSTGTKFDVQVQDTTLEAGVRQRLPTGTTVEATVQHERNRSNRTIENQEARVGLTITQSLLRGFGPAVNLARVRQAELDVVASIYELRHFTETLLAETEIAYWEYVLAREEIAIFERSLDISKRGAEEIDERIKVGALPEKEVSAARAEVALREQALIDARSALEARRLRLLRLMNIGPGALSRPVEPTSAARVDTVAIDDLDERLALADATRPDLNEARVRLDQNRLETILTRNGLLPRLDLFVTVGVTGFSDTFRESFREIDGSTYDLAGGIELSHVLGNRAAKGRNLAALATREQAGAAVENLRQLIEFDVRLAVNEAERARQQIAASRTTRELQQQSYETESERFDVGASTAFLVSQAQRDLLAAEIAEIDSVIRHRIALVRLYLAEGSLLDRRGILLDMPSNY